MRKVLLSSAAVAGALLAAVAGVSVADRPAPPPPPAAAAEPMLPCADSGGRPVDVPRFWVGRSFEGLELAEQIRRCDTPSPVGRANYMSYIYGDCEVAEGDHGCAPPLEIQSFPACERHAGSPRATLAGDPLPHEDVTVGGRRGAVYEHGQRLELYTRTATVVIFGNDPAQVRRAGAAIRAAERGPGTVTMDCAAPQS